MSSLNIAIAIATAGRREQMTLTMAQLNTLNRPPSKVLVCPATPEDFDEGCIASLHYPVEIVRGPRGLCAQRNTILRAAQDIDVLIFIDDDFYPTPNYVNEIARIFDEGPTIVIATGYPALDGATGPGIPHELAAQKILELSDQAPERIVVDTYGGYGCNMSIRLNVVRFNDLWFDERLPLYGWLEDVDFSRRLAPFGRIVNSSSLQGVHLATKRGRTAGVRLGYSQIANPIYMIRKGSVSARYALAQIGRNVVKNLVRSFWPEAWVDRHGRLKGNLIGFMDLARGRLHPEQILKL